MARTERLRTLISKGLIDLALRMEDVDGLFGKVGRDFAGEGSGELSVMECHFLAAISEAAPANGVTLARRLGLTRGGVSKMAARLQAKKFIEARRLAGDRKSLRYVLTDAGKKAVAIHDALHNLAEDLLWARLKDCPETELELFGRMLIRVSAALAEVNKDVLANARILLAKNPTTTKDRS